MTEDPRISEIREALAKFEATDVAWPLMQEVPAVSALVDSLGEILDRLAPASQVFLPGDVLPPNVAILNTVGVLYGPAPGWVVGIPGVAVQIPTAAEVEALVEQELNERDAA